MPTRDYAFDRTFAGVTFEDARRRMVDALQGEGFGVLTEIDVKATMKKKLDVEFRKYAILGACNPPAAHKVLSEDAGMGLLLPCNVVVTEDEDHNAVVMVADPQAMLRVVGDKPALESTMRDIREKLQRALDNA